MGASAGRAFPPGRVSDDRGCVIEPTTEVVGWHGTCRADVARLLDLDLEMSGRPYDWLGAGFYLWQDSPWRAHEWATQRYGPDAAVVVARVSLQNCMDLLDPQWQGHLAAADAQFCVETMAAGHEVPTNRGGNRARDNATINWFCDRAGEMDLYIRSVRAIFEEGEPIFADSAIRSLSHLQIAVRDPGVILEIEEVTL